MTVHPRLSSKLTTEHPEILTFVQDQMKMSPAVARYVERFRKSYPTLFTNLSLFRKLYHNTQKIVFDDIRTLYEMTGWTHTDTQQKSAIDFLRNVSRKYPTPPEFAQIEQGLLLNISDVADTREFYHQLDICIAKVQALPTPQKIACDLSEVGYLPISLIHKTGSTDYLDPLLSNGIDTVWTMDVSVNPGLSIKDVIAKYMIDDAIKAGKITQDTILVEGTSGNTGTGIAIVAGTYGYKSILVIPDKMSLEKIERLRHLGAHTIVVPTKVDAGDPKSYYTVRDYIAHKTGGWRGNQYDNPSNARSHFETTGPMIWSQTRGEVTAVICTAGTSGTVSGIGRFLKKKNSKIKMIAIDSIGSILYLLKEGYTIEQVQSYARGYKIQGFGEDIYPKNLDIEVVDHFIRVGDMSGLSVAQLLPSLGYINGQSSGAAYAGLIEALDQKLVGKADKVVVIFPDIGFTYRGDLYDDEWMKKNGFLLPGWQ